MTKKKEKRIEKGEFCIKCAGTLEKWSSLEFRYCQNKKCHRFGLITARYAPERGI